MKIKLVIELTEEDKNLLFEDAVEHDMFMHGWMEHLIMRRLKKLRKRVRR